MKLIFLIIQIVFFQNLKKVKIIFFIFIGSESVDILNKAIGVFSPSILEKSKEFPFYRKISKNKDYQFAKAKIRNEFTPKPYIEEFPNVENNNKENKKNLSLEKDY